MHLQLGFSQHQHRTLRLAAVLLGLLVWGTASLPVLALDAVAAPAPARVKVLVLDVETTELTEGERSTISSIIATHLSRYRVLDVMTSVDIKNLANLESARQTAGCSDASCLSEIAGALGAELVLYGQAGKLGQSLVVTLSAFDSAKGTAMSRRQIEVRDASQLKTALPGAVDALLAPLFERGVMGGAQAFAITDDASSAVALGARGLALYDAKKFAVCTGSNATQWFFCQQNAPVDENTFVRHYQAMTGEVDLRFADVNRNERGMLLPAALLGTGAVLAAVSVGTAVATFALAVPFLNEPSPSFASLPLGADVALGTGVVGLGFLAFGGYQAYEALRYVDTPSSAHTLTEAQGRAAVVRHNTALEKQIQADLGAAGEATP